MEYIEAGKTSLRRARTPWTILAVTPSTIQYRVRLRATPLIDFQNLLHSMYLETTDDEDMNSSSRAPGSREADSNLTTGNHSIPARLLDALTAGFSSLFSRFNDPEPSTRSGKERVEEPDKNFDNTNEGGTAERYKDDSSEKLGKRVKRLRARYPKTPPGPMKEAIPVLIRDIEAELDRRRC